MRNTLSVAALVAGSIISAAGMAAEPLGRLFFTPAQRSALDAGKQNHAPGPMRALTAAGPPEVTLNGVVTRSDGASTVWVNGRVLDEKSASGVSATASGSDPAVARVKLSGARNAMQMRVGQRLLRSSGTIAEPYDSVARKGGEARRGGKELESSRKREAPLDSAATADHGADK